MVHAKGLRHLLVGSASNSCPPEPARNPITNVCWESSLALMDVAKPLTTLQERGLSMQQGELFMKSPRAQSTTLHIAHCPPSHHLQLASASSSPSQRRATLHVFQTPLGEPLPSHRRRDLTHDGEGRTQK